MLKTSQHPRHWGGRVLPFVPAQCGPQIKIPPQAKEIGLQEFFRTLFDVSFVPKDNKHSLVHKGYCRIWDSSMDQYIPQKILWRIRNCQAHGGRKFLVKVFQNSGAGETVQWLGTLDTLREDLTFIHSSHLIAPNHLWLQFEGIWCGILSSADSRHASSTLKHT